jgi:hypothetical protein
MPKEPTIYDFLPPGRGFANTVDYTVARAAPDTPDADLYRIVVAHALREGRFQTKAEFDAEVRNLGTVARADEIIASRNSRPDCAAFQIGHKMMCDCGVTWDVHSNEPIPNCRKQSGQ